RDRHVGGGAADGLLKAARLVPAGAELPAEEVDADPSDGDQLQIGSHHLGTHHPVSTSLGFGLRRRAPWPLPPHRAPPLLPPASRCRTASRPSDWERERRCPTSPSRRA